MIEGQRNFVKISTLKMCVTTNSIKGAYYLKNSNGLDVNLKPLSEIVRDETS